MAWRPGRYVDRDFYALAGRVLANPRSLTGGVALARAHCVSWTTRAWSLAMGSLSDRADRPFTSSACCLCGLRERRATHRAVRKSGPLGDGLSHAA
jgi:hypothetical protein